MKKESENEKTLTIKYSINIIMVYLLLKNLELKIKL